MQAHTQVEVSFGTKYQEFTMFIYTSAPVTVRLQMLIKILRIQEVLTLLVILKFDSYFLHILNFKFLIYKYFIIYVHHITNIK